MAIAIGPVNAAITADNPPVAAAVPPAATVAAPLAAVNPPNNVIIDDIPNAICPTINSNGPIAGC